MSVRGHLSQLVPQHQLPSHGWWGASNGMPGSVAGWPNIQVVCRQSQKVKGEQLASLWSGSGLGDEGAWAADHMTVMQLAEPQECGGTLMEVRWSVVQSLLLGHRNEGRSPVKDVSEGPHLKWLLVEYIQS